MAGEILMGVSKDERERAVFRSRRMYETDMASNYATVWDEGKKEGREEGIVIGERGGIKKGVVKNRKEVARIMLEAGEPIEKIMAYSRLTREEIERLKK